MLQLQLDQRRSVPTRQLAAPAPDSEQLLELLRVATRVPDHGALAPFRFLRISGEARGALGELLATRRAQLEPGIDAALLDKERGRFIQAPLVVAVVGCFRVPHKIPLIEQQLAVGCVCLQLLQAAQAAGFGAQWLTGWAAYDPVICAHLGLSQNESVVGFIHLGTPREPAGERPRPDPAELLSEWQP
jgi:nitroreductase